MPATVPSIRANRFFKPPLAQNIAVGTATNRFNVIRLRYKAAFDAARDELMAATSRLGN